MSSKARGHKPPKSAKQTQLSSKQLEANALSAEKAQETAAQAEQVLNLKLATLDMLQPKYHAVKELQTIRELQHRFFACFKQESELISFLSKFMHANYDFAQDKGWALRQKKLLCLDFSTTGLILISGYFQGFYKFSDLIAMADKNLEQRVALHTLFPLTLPFTQPYMAMPILSTWLTVMLCAQIDPQTYQNDQATLRQNFIRLLDILKLLQPCAYGTILHYDKISELTEDGVIKKVFNTPRFDLISFVGSDLTLATAESIFEFERPLPLNLVDCTNKRDLFYLFEKRVTSEGEAMHQLIAALKENGQNMSRVLFWVWHKPTSDQISKAILEAGANYLFFMTEADFPNLDEALTFNELGQLFYKWRHCFADLNEFASFTQQPVENFPLLSKLKFKFVTSLDLNKEDNAEKLYCAIDEVDLGIKKYLANIKTAKFGDNMDACVTLYSLLSGLSTVKQDFQDFVLAQLHQSEQLAYAQEMCQERKVKRRISAERISVSYVLKVPELFWHFFGKFMQAYYFTE